MKRLIFAFMVAAMPLCMSAQNAGLFGGVQTSKAAAQDYSAYMQGAVPEQDGKVVFTKTIAAPGKSKAEIYQALASWASTRYMPNVENGKWNDKDYFRNLAYSTVKSGSAADGHIICQGSEEQVFSNKILEKDFTEMEYVLDLRITDGQVVATMTDIAYRYTFTSVRERKPAEEVITDASVFTKKGKWIKAYRKFRIKTVDLAAELFREIEVSIK